MILVMNQRIRMNHGKMTKMRNTSQIQNWRLYYANVFEEDTVWDFSYLKTWFDQEKFVYPLYCPCGKIHKPWVEKENILCIIEDDLGDIELCHNVGSKSIIL